MKKLSLLLMTIVLSSCVEAPNRYTQVMRTGDYAVELTSIFILIGVVLMAIIVCVNLGGIKEKIKELNEKYANVNKITERRIDMEYSLNKDLYGKDYAVKVLKEYLIGEYIKGLPQYPSENDVEMLSSKLKKQYGFAIEDSGIALPDLKEYTNYVIDLFKGYTPGTKCKLKGAYEQIGEIEQIDLENRRVRAKFGYSAFSYDLDNIEIIAD